MKTGNTTRPPEFATAFRWPQWSPVMKTGNTRLPFALPAEAVMASMEPGHEDREYLVIRPYQWEVNGPQWSPVMKTGNTGRRGATWTIDPQSLNGARS